MHKFDPIIGIERLCKIGERQFQGERQAASYIKKILFELSIPFTSEPFTTRLPRIISAKLFADNQSIPCLATSFVSGEIKSNDNLISSLTNPESFLYDANINFNPRCPKSISRSNHYFAPSVAIAREDVDAVIKAENIFGKIQVEPTSHETEYILIGNLTNPKTILFCHYDSIGPGAIDNASGVATLLAIAINNRKLLQTTLFVFDGNEELSYDEPIYWGAGYRVFEKRHENLLAQAKAIIVVDCIGNSPLLLTKDLTILKLAFPIKNIEKYTAKTQLATGNFNALMRVYHSDADTPDSVDATELDKTINQLTMIIKYIQ